MARTFMPLAQRTVRALPLLRGLAPGLVAQLLHVEIGNSRNRRELPGPRW